MDKIQYIDVDSIKPADYNPRKISDLQFEELKKSIKEIGFVIPILINHKNNTIIAGHQRTKAAKALGIKKIPCIFLSDIEIGDEIKFNQLHNGCEYDQNAIGKYIGSSKLGYNLDANAKFTISQSTPTIVKEICKIILKYGNVLFSVCAGAEIIVGHNYIKACKLLNYDVNISMIDTRYMAKAKQYLNSNYGQYSYEHIPRHSYVQGLAQLVRSVTDRQDNKRNNHSALYDNYVIPYVQGKKYDILDFGCGKGSYIKALSKTHDAYGLEFYNHNYSQIIVSKGNEQIDAMIKHINEKGFFDIVICDSVLNSVDSQEAETSTIQCCNLFCKDRLFLSGRPIEQKAELLTYKKDSAAFSRSIEFFDDHHFTAIYRKGNWYFQHWHTKEDVEKLLCQNGFKILKLVWRKYSDSWQVEAKKVEQLPIEIYNKAIDFEFNLPLPQGKRYNRHEDVKKAVKPWLLNI